MFENITKGEFFVEKNVGYGRDTNCVCIKNRADKIFIGMRKPKEYYTDFVKTEDGGTILSTELAERSGKYVATEDIKKTINDMEKQNAEFICFCFNLQQKYDIVLLEECVRLLEYINKNFDDVYENAIHLNTWQHKSLIEVKQLLNNIKQKQ